MSWLEEERPFPFTADHPRFRIEGWSELLGKDELIDAPDMVRHFLATGETGCGKSRSAVIPLLKGILRYPEEGPYAEYRKKGGLEERTELKPAAFVVDPKQELRAIVEKNAGGRNVIHFAYGETGPVVHFFEGLDLETLDAADAVDMILAQSQYYVQEQEKSDEPGWTTTAANHVKDVVAIDVWLARNKGPHAVRDFWSKIAGGEKNDPEDAHYKKKLEYDPVNYFRRIQIFFALAADDSPTTLGSYLEQCLTWGVPGDLQMRLITLIGMYHSTKSGVLYSIDGILSELAADELASCVSLNPLEAPPNAVSLFAVLNQGDVVVYTPTPYTSSVADTIARCIKTKFFDFAFARSNKVRPFFYVVDEAHRFLSAGEEDGEQGLLDRCRAYRAGVVLASQSLASMAFRLQNTLALQIVLNNCGNSLFFRTSDVQTQENLRERIPQAPMPDRPHVVRVRPLASLPVGCCYALRANGAWGLFQVHLPE